MKAIVTGGAGFIGSHLVDELLRQGFEVISIDNYSTGKKENLKHLLIHKKGRMFTEVEADIRDIKKIAPYFKGVKYVFNLMASKKTVCLKSPVEDCSINAGGTLGLLRLAKKAGVEKFIHASTGSVYEEVQSRIGEMNEPIWDVTNEESKLAPVSFYGISKLAGESYVRLYAKDFGMDTLILRYFHVYGQRQDFSQYGGVVSIFINKILKNEPITIFGDGSQMRQLTYFKDVVDYTIGLAKINTQAGSVYNICTEEKNTIFHLAKLISEKLGYSSATYEDEQMGDIKIFNVSNAKAIAIMPHIFRNLKTGLNETIRYYQQAYKG